MAAAVVSGGKDRKEATACESLEAIHDAFVSTQDEVNLVVVEEGLHAIGAELHDISSAVGVADKVWLDTKLTVTVRRITPKDVNNKLLLDGGDFVNDLEWPLDLLYLLKADEGTSDSTVQADYSILDNGGKG